MESIGQYLRLAREERGLSIDQVSRDTNISRHFIVALEEDKHEVFPAEPYVIGFLRNYSEHLGLNTEELIAKYRTVKIQEQPAPMEELIRKPSPWPTRLLVGGSALVVLVVLVVFVVPAAFEFVAGLPKALAAASAPKEPRSFALAADKAQLTQRLYTGDTVALDDQGQTFTFTLKAIGDETVLSGAPGDYKLRLGDEVFLDLNGDNVNDLRLFLKDVVPAEPDRGAEFAFERLVAPPTTLNTPGTLGDEVKPGMAAAGTVSGASVEQKAVVILTDVAPKPFTVDVTFRGYALFRYVTDDNLREEAYFHKGDTVRIDASRKIKIWVSNAGAFAGKVNATTDFEIGRSGEVVARTIEWGKDAQGKSNLVANPLN
jgi:cytoskeletal protein RodZ